MQTLTTTDGGPTTREAQEIELAPSAYQTKLLGERIRDQRRIVTLLAAQESISHFKLACRIAQCCRCAVIAQRSDGSLRMQEMRCKSKLCPICSKRRAAAVFHRVTTAVKKMNSARFVTLTLKSTEAPLREQLIRLRKCFAEFRRSTLWKKSVTAGIYTLEITYNPTTKLWHPHIHIIADGSYVHQKTLSTAWLRQTGDSSIVHIRKIHDASAAATYVSKYVAKTIDPKGIPDDALLEWITEVRSIRFVQTFGALHAQKLDTRERTPKDTDPSTAIGNVEPLAHRAANGDGEARLLLGYLTTIRHRRVSTSQPQQPFEAPAGERKIADRLRTWFSMYEAKRREQIAQHSRANWVDNLDHRTIWQRQDEHDPPAAGPSGQTIDNRDSNAPR